MENKKKNMKGLKKIAALALSFALLINIMSTPIVYAGFFQLVDNESRTFPALTNTFENDIDAKGNISNSTGDVTINDTLNTTGAAEFDSSVGADGNLRVGSAGASKFTVDATNGNTVITGTTDQQGAISSSTGDVSINDNASVTGVFTINLPDNTATALEIKQGENSYMKIVTTDSGEEIVFNEAGDGGGTDFGGNVTVSGDTTFGDGAGDTTTVAGAFSLTTDQIQIPEGGTGSTTADGARIALDVPSRSGAGATGDWSINVSGTASNITGVAGDDNVTNDLTIETTKNATVGDLAVNGGDITTTEATGNIFNTGATTINFGGAATAIEIGSASGTTSVNNGLTVDGDAIFNNPATFTESAEFDDGTLVVDNTNNRVGVGTKTPGSQFEVEEPASLSEVVFTGTGLNDMVVSGTFTGEETIFFIIQVTTEDPTGDWISVTIMGGEGGGGDYQLEADMTINLGYGVTIGFDSPTGHTLYDQWSFQGNPKEETTIDGGTVTALIGNFGTGTLTISDSGISDNNGPLNLSSSAWINLNPTNGVGIYVGDTAGDYFNVKNGTLMVDGPTSRVGIGTTSPNQKLSVLLSGNGSITGPTSGTWASSIVNQQDTSGYNGLSVQNRWANTDSTIFEAAMGWDGASTGYYPVFTIDGVGQAIFKPQRTEAMRIASDGNVGIGSTSPGSLLEVQKNAGSTRMLGVNQTAGSISADVMTVGGYAGSGYDLLKVEDSNAGTLGSGTTRFVIEAGGNTGIGTTSPQTKLTVGDLSAGTGEATYNGLIQIQGNQDVVADIGGGDNGIEFKSVSGSNGYGWIISSPDRGSGNVPLTFGYRKQNASWTEFMTMRLDASDGGRLGIGTNAPNNIFQVKDYINFNSAYTGHTAIGYQALNSNTGNYNVAVGYGASSANTSGTKNTAIGTSTNVFNQVGSDNTAVGYYALTGVSGNSNSGNTAVGSNALTAVTTGVNNVAVGYGAGDSVTSGIQNVMVGINAGSASSTGEAITAVGSYAALNNTAHYTTAVGAQSLYNQTSGVFNAGIGYQSLYYNTTGGYNTAVGNYANKGTSGYSTDGVVAVGYAALLNNRTGYNTAIGYGAADSNTTGQQLVAIGRDALGVNSTGSYSTAVGYQALDASTGNYNTALGNSALGNVSSGSGNTAVGYSTGGGITTNNYCTFLGYNANATSNYTNCMALGNGASVNADNKIVIGNASATTVGGYGNWSNYSDRNLKENIVDNNTLGLDFLNKLRPVNYNLISQPGNTQEGFIAQEVESAMDDLDIEFSGLIEPEEEGNHYMLSYGKFVVPLVTAVKELDMKFGETVRIDESGNASIGMTIPVIVSSRATTGGTLSGGTYYYKVTSFDGVNETLASEEVSTIVDGVDNNAVKVIWAEVPGATSYRIYRGTSSDGQNTYFTTTNNEYTDTGSTGTSGTVPTSSTAETHRFSINGDSWVTGGNFGIGVKFPDAPLAVAGDMKSYGNTIYFDSDNAGAGANVDIVAQQGTDNPGKIRYDATDNEWKISNDGGSFEAINTGNADTIDTLDSLQFLRSDTSDNFTSGTLTFDAGTTLDIEDATVNLDETTSSTFTLDTDNTGSGANVDIVAEQGTDANGILRYDATDNEWKISNDGGSFTAIPVANVFDAYDSTGNTSVTTTETVLNLDSTNISDGAYTLASDVVTINKYGVYKVTGRLTVDSLDQTGDAKSSIILSAEKNTGSGFTDIPGALCQDVMFEDNTAGTTSASCTINTIQTFNNTDQIRLTHQMNGTTTAQTVPGGSALMIELIR